MYVKSTYKSITVSRCLKKTIINRKTLNGLHKNGLNETLPEETKNKLKKVKKNFSK